MNELETKELENECQRFLAVLREHLAEERCTHDIKTVLQEWFP